MKKVYIILFFIVYQFILPIGTIQGQSNRACRIGFYNTENFFDVFPDSTREYNAFTPEGEQHWDYDRFQKKRNNIYKTIIALGEGKSPDIMGLCEVENEVVLRELIFKTPLKSSEYQYVMYPTPDRRGINVGIIYRIENLRLLSSKAILVKDYSEKEFFTRNILYASFIVSDIDTLHLFINHWPSRYGGTLATTEKRMLAAKTLKINTDSIFKRFPHAKIVIMGDFNDCPEDESLIYGLQITNQNTDIQSNDLIDLCFNNDKLGFVGTLKYEHQWQIFDQIIVSGNLIKATQGLAYKNESARIFHPPFLFIEDERYLGLKLFRTYTGPTYEGGFSDHLPVYFDLEWR